MPWDSEPIPAVTRTAAWTDPPLPPAPAFSWAAVAALEDVNAVGVADVAAVEGNDFVAAVDAAVAETDAVATWQQQRDNLGGRGSWSDVDLTSADNSADIADAAAMPLLLFERRRSAAADHPRVRVPRR